MTTPNEKVLAALKPCPFCGCEVSPRDRFNIKCEGCGVEMNALPHLLYETWNRRAALSMPESVAPVGGEVVSRLEIDAVVLPIWYDDAKEKPYRITEAIHALIQSHQGGKQ